MATLITGPRLGRFDAQRAKPSDFAPSSPVFQALGTFILWLGWYGERWGVDGLGEGRGACRVTLCPAQLAAGSAC